MRGADGWYAYCISQSIFGITDPFPAIDVWAVGMILLFFLTGKFPLFQSNDDVEALMEIAVVIGRNKMEHVATLHSKPVKLNTPPHYTSDYLSFKAAFSLPTYPPSLAKV